MDRHEGEWSKYYPYFILAFCLAMGVGGALTAYTRENTGSWMTYLIAPLIGTAFFAFLLVNYGRFTDVPSKAHDRCIWCDRPWPRDFCSGRCEGEYGRYRQHLDRLVYVFIICLFIPIILLVVPVSEGLTQFVTGLLCSGFGASFIVFSSAFPEDAGGKGVKNTLRLSCIIGFIMFVCGLAILIYAPPL